MADENRCCSCTTPEITIKLNKQGPQGLVGPQGNPGFSPVITVEEDTSTNYKLNIQTEQGSFITPNLKGSIPAGGSAGSVLTRTESGEAEFAPLPFATTENAGIVVFATQEDIEDGETGLAVDSGTMSNYYTKTQTDGKYVDLTSQQDVTGRKIFSDLRTNSIAEPNGNTYISYYRDGVDSNLNSVTIGGINTPNVYINRGGLIGTNIDSNNIGSYALTSLPIATTSTLGGVKVDGTTITIDANGVISGASTYVLPTASTITLGGVKIDGTTITIDNNGVISSQAGGPSYTAGNGIDITNDEISIDTSVVATQSDIPTNYVTTDTQQTITGYKDFTHYIYTPGIQSNGGSVPFTIVYGGAGQYTGIRLNSNGSSVFGDSGSLTTINTNSDLTIVRSNTAYTNIDSGNLSANLPTATDSSLGVVKPDGTTITIDANGILSASSSTPSNMVTLDTAQTITGVKLFSQGLKVQGDVGIQDNNGVTFIKTDASLDGVGGYNWLIGSTGSRTQDFHDIYVKTTRGVNVNIDSDNIATNTTITNLTSRISTLEDTITALTNRIIALETAINGGNA